MTTATSPDFRFKNVWQIKKLVGMHIGAALILASFAYAPISGLWAAADESIFLALNGMIAWGDGWAKFAAVTNTKIYDALSGLMLAFIMLAYVLWGLRHNDFTRRLAGMVFIGLYMTITTVVRRKIGIMEYDRHSPSLVGLPFHNIHEMFPEMKPKYESISSFPGDHGIACVILVTLFWFYAGRAWGLATLAVTPFFLVPRLMGGGHWFTDIAVGASVYGMIIIAWGMYSPLGAVCTSRLYRGFEAAKNKFLPRR